MIINWLAKRPWGQKVLAVGGFFVCGFSWGDTLQGTKNEQDAKRKTKFWGFLDPRMKEHWDRLADPNSPDYGSWYHSWKNILAEWARLDPQRAVKATSFLAVSTLALLILVVVLILLSAAF